MKKILYIIFVAFLILAVDAYAFCSNSYVAVCWDGGSYVNPYQSGAFCTYKSTSYTCSTCTGGGAPGLLYCWNGASWVYTRVDDCGGADIYQTSGSSPSWTPSTPCGTGPCCDDGCFKSSGSQPTGVTDSYSCGSGDTIVFRDYYCTGSSSSYSYTDSTTSDCDDSDDWYGSTWCSSDDVYQEYRDYYCSGGSCTYLSSNLLKDDCDQASGYGCEGGACVLQDEDLDGVFDISDNCVSDSNALQDDYDLDGIGDMCDPCPYTGAGDSCVEADAQEITAASGGSAASPSGDLEITVPAGALASDETIILEDTGDWQGGYGSTWYGWTMSTANHFGPAGTTFSQPVEVCFTFDTWGLGTCANNPFSVGKDSEGDYYYESRLGQSACTDLPNNQMKLCAETTSFSNFMVLFDGCLKDSDVRLNSGDTYTLGLTDIFSYTMTAEAEVIAATGYTVYPSTCVDALANGYVFTSSFNGNATTFCVNKTTSTENSLLEVQDITYLAGDMLIDEVVGSGEFCSQYQYNPGGIPEFSTIGIVLAMIIAAAGIVVIVKRK